jgi:hypothetical protein
VLFQREGSDGDINPCIRGCEPTVLSTFHLEEAFEDEAVIQSAQGSLLKTQEFRIY